MRTTGTGQDQIRYPTMLAGRIAYLASVAGTADFPPNDSMREVHGVLRGRLAEAQAAFDEIVESGLVDLNRALEAEGVPGVVRVEGKTQ